MSNAFEMPFFIDFEASSLSVNSYPIEVGFNVEDHVRSILINPHTTHGWTDWVHDSQALHGISRAQLARHGRIPRIVAQSLNNAFLANTVYSDAPDFDRFWNERLFEAADLQCTHQIRNVASLLLDFAPEDISTAHVRAEAEGFRHTHRAALDVAHMMKVWQLLHE